MKKKILHHTSIMIIFAVLVTFLAASVVTYSKLNTYMQRESVRKRSISALPWMSMEIPFSQKSFGQYHQVV